MTNECSRISARPILKSLSMRAALLRMRSLAPTLLVPIIASCAAIGGQGVLHDSSTGMPVEGADVRLDCSATIYQPGHAASGVIRTLHTITNQAGEYSFATTSLIGCSEVYLVPAKEGYVNTNTIDPGGGSGQAVPKSLYMTALADVTMKRLQVLVRDYAVGGFTRKGIPYPPADYQSFYRGFFEAKRLAKTSRETDFVVQSFCAKLIAINNQLSDEDRIELGKLTVSFAWSGKQARGLISHQSEVAPFCEHS